MRTGVPCCRPRSRNEFQTTYRNLRRALLALKFAILLNRWAEQGSEPYLDEYVFYVGNVLPASRNRLYDSFSDIGRKNSYKQ